VRCPGTPGVRGTADEEAVHGGTGAARPRIFWVVNGAVELFAALSHREMSHRGWMSVLGILSIVAGIILLAYPGLSLVVLSVIVSVWLLVFGLMEISVAWRIRSASHLLS
jgi:uncharacterized membrane protein HdeD (DUF308 family)